MNKQTIYIRHKLTDKLPPKIDSNLLNIIYNENPPTTI